MKTVTVPVEWLNKAKRTHYSCEDCWYSCPKSGDGCCDDRQGDECNCGTDKWNAEVDAMLAAAQQEDQRESPSNPSPSTGQSKQGLTAIEAGAPTLSPAPDSEVDYKSMYQSLLADHAREIESADKLLREIASIWRPAAGEYNGLLERLDAYLKGKA